MNEIAFGTKRAFHGFLRVTRKLLASYGLTAARFDLMCALQEDPRADAKNPPVRQSELRRTLGVTAPVVSRMVTSLVSLGLVAREKRGLGWDRRQRWITLTERGLAVMRVARRVVLRSVQRLVYIAICYGRHRDPNRRFIQMEVLESFLRTLRSHFCDRATLYFPWGHPDD